MNAKNSLEAVFEDLSTLTSQDDDVPVNKRPVTLWIPEEYQLKYEKLQVKTKRKFGKILQKLAMTAIDRVDLEKI